VALTTLRSATLRLNLTVAMAALGFISIVKLSQCLQGMAVALSTMGSATLGLKLTVAIALHNIPEGLGMDPDLSKYDFRLHHVHVIYIHIYIYIYVYIYIYIYIYIY